MIMDVTDLQNPWEDEIVPFVDCYYCGESISAEDTRVVHYREVCIDCIGKIRKEKKMLKIACIFCGYEIPCYYVPVGNGNGGKSKNYVCDDCMYTIEEN